MVIGEQLVQQQQQRQQQQIIAATATHRLTATQQQNHHHNQQLQQQQQQQQNQQQHHNRRSSTSTTAISNVIVQGIPGNNNNIVVATPNNNSINPNSNHSSLNNTACSSTSNPNINVNTNIVNNNNGNNKGSSSNNNGQLGNSSIVGLVGGGTSTVAAKNQLEQLSTMREALFSQDGWGCQHVNQDTNWEVPSSPEPTNKDPTGAPAMWKPTINNGTDLWESNLRNGGQPPTQPVQKTPWGHTPSSNLGGTWGEDDDGADSSSVWTGGSSANASTSGVGAANVGAGGGPGGAGGNPQWGQSTVGVGVGVGTAGAVSGAATGNIGGVTTGGVSSSAGVNVPGVGAAAGGASSGTGNGWGDPRELRGAGPMGGTGPIDMRSVDPMRAASAGDPRDLRMLDPRDPIRGDPRGISGRLNGTSEMWGQHHPIAAQHQIPAMNKMVGPGGGATVVAAGGNVTGIGPGAMNAAAAAAVATVGVQWGAAATAQAVVGPKDLNVMSGGGKQVSVSGWEESPPQQRRNIPNYDDGTSVWGQQSRVPGGGSHWKDIPDPMNRTHLLRSSIGVQNAPNAGVVGGLGGNGAVSNLVGGGQAGLGAPNNPNNPMGNVGPQGRLAAVGPGGVGVSVGGHNKTAVDNTMWVHQGGGGGGGGRNAGTSWSDDNNHNVGAATSSNWADDKTNAGLGQIGANVGTAPNSWNDSSASWSKNPNKMSGGAAGWGAGAGANVGVGDSNDLNTDWTSAHGGLVVGKSQPKLGVGGMSVGVGVGVGVGGLNTDMIKQSKQYRILVDAGFKKDDVERALLSANMNIEEAAELLRNNAATAIVMDSWRRHDEATLGSYDHTNSTVSSVGGFPGRYPTAAAQPTMSFPPVKANFNNLLNNMGGGAGGANNSNLAALNSMQPLQVQKYLNQGPPHNIATGGPQSVNAATAVAFGQVANAANVTAAAVNAAATNSNNQPSAQQLRMLVQQIQLAVHSGYLSGQILNQPLAPPTLLLLNQLLTNIKHLQGAQQQLGRGNNANNIQLNLAVAKYKQQIQNLQTQINAQQALYIKQQQQQQNLQQQQQQQQNQQPHPATAHVNTNNEYLRGHDAISALQGNFSDMNLNKSSGYQGAPNQQSRLNQWKLPVLEKDMTTDSTDFSRAPGATKQSLTTSNVNNMGPLGLQSDGTWSTGRNIGDGWPDTTNDNENKDWSVAQPTPATAYTDLVQEFEPGKPWKGSQIKSIEDDPSITPGSVARSPLSINPTPKEADIFANASKNSPTDLTPLSLSSSTWSFNPSTNNQNFPSWSDNPQQCAASELWVSAMNKTSRGPPPGLGANKAGGVNVPAVTNPNVVNVSGGSINGWLGGGSRGVVPNVANSNWTTSGANTSWSSNWLLLKNLTSQIDGSTLRTLCMQHGPLITFHLYLNQGIALCKYATREEANKAQMTLNNCVLGNTTICAESPSENEVQSILQHLPQTSTTPGGGGGGNGGVSGGGGSVTPSAANPNVSGGNGSGSAGNASNGSGGNNGNGSSGAVVNGGNSNAANNTVNSAVGNAGGNAQNQITCAGTATNGSGSAGNGSQQASGNNSGGGPTTVGGNVQNAACSWRQNQQQQQQNQARPMGREVDLDYISKYVNSIVDD